jgi:hypothetical protein
MAPGVAMRTRDHAGRASGCMAGHQAETALWVGTAELSVLVVRQPRRNVSVVCCESSMASLTIRVGSAST